jgi:AcrR family transcriptional regulator
MTETTRVRLTREEVVSAALRLTRDVGLPGLTMRGLADALGVTPMAAYHWVDSKQALIELVLESVQDEIASTPREGTWRQRLASLATASRAAMKSYPGVGAVLIAAPAGPRARELMAEALDLLRQAGFRKGALGNAWSTYHAFMLGQFTLVTAALERSPESSIKKTGRALSSAGSDASFSWGLNLLLDALEQAAKDQ